MRRVLALMTLLVAGMLATWLTAWACAFVTGDARPLVIESAGEREMTSAFRGEWWAAAAQGTYDEPRYTIGVEEMRGRTRVSVAITGTGRLPGGERAYRDGEWLSADAVGWPCRALVGGISEGAQVRRCSSIGLPAWVSPSAGKNTLKRTLPVRPIPIGFTLDTIVYASVFGLLFWILRTVRRRRRLGRSVPVLQVPHWLLGPVL